MDPVASFRPPMRRMRRAPRNVPCMPHVFDGGQHGVFISDTDGGETVEEDEFGDTTSLLALSAADRSTAISGWDGKDIELGPRQVDGLKEGTGDGVGR